jgi:transcription initiation factor IIE alpha subunit
MSLDGWLVPLRGDVDTMDSLRDDDMAYLMGMNTKELHKLCGRLKEDRFLAV